MKQFVYSLMLIIVLACNKSENIDFQGETQAKIISFGFSDPILNKYSFTIDQVSGIIQNEDEILFGTNLKSIKAVFEIPEKCFLKVNGITQYSNATINDYSKPVVFDLFNQQGKQRSYTVKVILSADYSLIVDPRSPRNISGYKLVWSDEFNGIGAPDSRNWIYETGFVRNEELQWYLARNVSCGNGLLTIEGKREQLANPGFVNGSTDWKKNREFAEYTSGSVKSKGLQYWKYGWIELRARINTDMGSWPAFWLLGNSYAWPANGEIDVLEYFTKTILANFNWDVSKSQWNQKKYSLSKFTQMDANWDKKFHIWTFDWNEQSMSILLDGEVLNTQATNVKNTDGTYPFLQPHYLFLNLAIGATGGDPGQTTFPVLFEVDYVRVYQKKDI